MAKLYYRYGAMGSSKTANAIMVQYNYKERGQRVLMVKPQLDLKSQAWLNTAVIHTVSSGGGKCTSFLIIATNMVG